MAFELPPLPYPKNALEPHTSAQTLDFHHGKHHQAYVTNLNNLVKGTPMENQSLEEIIQATANDQSKAGIFNNAAQVWNHTFFWNCMKPNGGGNPSGDLAQAIDRDLGGLQKFKDDFKARAVGQFGSGWAWLVASGGKLSITSTPNAGHPLTAGPDRAPHLRRLGARLLSRLPEPPARLRAGLPRPPGQLGLRRPEPGEGEVARCKPLVIAGSSPGMTL